MGGLGGIPDTPHIRKGKYLIDFSSDGSICNVLARGLLSALGKMSRDFCLSFGYRSVQQFAQRFTNDAKVIEESGFEIVTNIPPHRKRNYHIRKVD